MSAMFKVQPDTSFKLLNYENSEVFSCGPIGTVISTNLDLVGNFSMQINGNHVGYLDVKIPDDGFKLHLDGSAANVSVTSLPAGGGSIKIGNGVELYST